MITCLPLSAKLRGHRDQFLPEEVGFVDPYHFGAPVQPRKNFSRILHRLRLHAPVGVRDDFVARIAVVQNRLEHLDAFARDHGAAQAAHQLFAFSRKHRAADGLDPTQIAGDKIHKQVGRILARGASPPVTSRTTQRVAIGYLSKRASPALCAYHWIMALAEQRVIVPELLDHAAPEDARPVLADLARVNRYFGGHLILRKIMSGLAERGESFSMLDVGAASGDLGAALRSRYPRATVVSLDRWAPIWATQRSRKWSPTRFNCRSSAASFDFVFSSLFLHHFSDQQIVELLGNFKRLARRAVLAIDLERGPLALRFLPATQWLFDWHSMFVHDGLISVQAAFKTGELLALARRAGLERARVATHRPWGRLSLVAPVSL